MGFPGLNAYAQQLPGYPGVTDPYELAAQMAYSTMMGDRQQTNAGLAGQLAAIRGAPQFAAPNLASWLGPNVMAEQRTDPYAATQIGNAQADINAAGAGMPSGLMAETARLKAQEARFQGYQQFTDQMQQMAMQQAQARQELALQLAGNLQQSFQAGVPPDQAFAGLQAMVGASGMEGLGQQVMPAFNAFYGGGLQQPQGPLESAIMGAVLKSYQPQQPQTYQQLGMTPPESSSGAFGAFPDVQRFAMSLLMQDPTAAPLVAQNPEAAAQMIAEAYRQTNATFAPGGTMFGGGPGAAAGAPTGDVTTGDRALNAGKMALAGAGMGAGIGSVVPVIGTGVGAAIGGIGGGLLGLLTAHDQPGDINVGSAAQQLGTGAVEGLAGRYMLGPLAGKGLMSMAGRFPMVGSMLGRAGALGESASMAGVGAPAAMNPFGVPMGRGGYMPGYAAMPGTPGFNPMAGIEAMPSFAQSASPFASMPFGPMNPGFGNLTAMNPAFAAEGLPMQGWMPGLARAVQRPPSYWTPGFSGWEG